LQPVDQMDFFAAATRSSSKLALTSALALISRHRPPRISSYILTLLEEIRGGRCREISANAEVSASFEEERVAAAKKSIWSTGCKSWYLDKNGVPASWPWSRDKFFEVMADPKLEAFDRV